MIHRTQDGTATVQNAIAAERLRQFETFPAIQIESWHLKIDEVPLFLLFNLFPEFAQRIYFSDHTFELAQLALTLGLGNVCGGPQTLLG